MLAVRELTMRPSKSFLAASVALGLVFACSGSDPTVEDRANEFMPVFCERLEQCDSAEYGRLFPQGRAACVKYGVDKLCSCRRWEEAQCSDEDLDRCADDIRAADCSAFKAATMAPPGACKKC